VTFPFFALGGLTDDFSFQLWKRLANEYDTIRKKY